MLTLKQKQLVTVVCFLISLLFCSVLKTPNLVGLFNITTILTTVFIGLAYITKEKNNSIYILKGLGFVVHLFVMWGISLLEVSEHHMMVAGVLTFSSMLILTILSAEYQCDIFEDADYTVEIKPGKGNARIELSKYLIIGLGAGLAVMTTLVEDPLVLLFAGAGLLIWCVLSCFSIYHIGYALRKRDNYYASGLGIASIAVFLIMVYTYEKLDTFSIFWFNIWLFSSSANIFHICRMNHIKEKEGL